MASRTLSTTPVPNTGHWSLITPNIINLRSAVVAASQLFFSQMSKGNAIPVSPCFGRKMTRLPFTNSNWTGNSNEKSKVSRFLGDCCMALAIPPQGRFVDWATDKLTQWVDAVSVRGRCSWAKMNGNCSIEVMKFSDTCFSVFFYIGADYYSTQFWPQYCNRVSGLLTWPARSSAVIVPGALQGALFCCYCDRGSTRWIHYTMVKYCHPSAVLTVSARSGTYGVIEIASFRRLIMKLLLR
jgi:hypothetical protein